MKTRNGFVSNSSSSSFMITNTSDKKLKLVDFVKENIYLLDEFLDQYDWYKQNPSFNKETMIKLAKSKYYAQSFNPKESKVLVFGDEDGTVLGHVFDYILREGGTSENWKWNYYENLH